MAARPVRPGLGLCGSAAGRSITSPGCGSSSASGSPAGRGLGRLGPASRIARTSAALKRWKLSARSSAATSAARSVGGLERDDRRELGGKPLRPGRGGGAQVPLGDSTGDPPLRRSRPEAVAEREPHIVGVRHDHLGDRRRPQTRHPIREHHRRRPARLLEALRQQRQHRLPTTIRGEANEPPARSRQHRAEERERPLLRPVDHQVAAQRRQPGPEAAAAPMGSLGLGNRAAEAPIRALVAGARAATSNRFAEIRPCVRSTRSAIRFETTSVLRGRREHSGRGPPSAARPPAAPSSALSRRAPPQRGSCPARGTH